MNDEQQKLVEEHVEFAQKLAAIFSGESTGNKFDDALSDAYLGLCMAAEKFTGGNDASFRTYAWRYMNGYMLNGIKERSGDVQFNEFTEETLAIASLNVLHEPGESMPVLSGAEREAIEAVVMGEMTQDEYAIEQGVSHVHIYRLIETAKAKLQRLGKERLTEMLI